jgi:hypothetical protein
MQKTPPAPRPRVFEKPVAWLFGPQLIGGLKGILLYTAYGDKLDPRDWMTGEVFSFDNPEKQEFWFDYLADAGDGTKAMYSLAYLTLCRGLWTKLTPNTTDLPTQLADCEVKTTNDSGFTYQLPRGEFLFVGGDTAYHASDYMTLVNRIQHPFAYAFLDLVKNELIAANEPRRPIFGIPGNHDYYDQVDGFRRQFRKPVRPEGPLPPAHSDPTKAQLTLAGFKRVQEASYVSLRLPFGWWFWGLDIESGVIDRRQKRFFRSMGQADDSQFQPPNKLILATSTPSTVFGRVAIKDQTITKSLDYLEVDGPFLPGKDAAGKPVFQNTGDAQLKPGQCRLDLSGDVHHYARYWGPKPANGSSPRKNSTAPQPSGNSYASVVSGSGGAFHHPSATYNNEICEQVLYPPATTSCGAVADQLFKFWTVMRGGYVWLAGAIIAFTLFFGATGPKSSRQFISNIGFLQDLGLVKYDPIQPTIVKLGDKRPCDTVKPFALWTSLGLIGPEWQPPAGCTVEKPTYFFPDTSKWPLDLIMGQIFLWASTIVIVLTFVLSVFTKKIFDDKNPYDEGADPHRKLWPILIGTALLVIVGFSSIYPYRHHITPYVSSLLVLYSLFAALTAIILNVRYSEYLFKKSFVSGRRGDWLLPWGCWIVAILVFACGLWFFGQNNLPAYLFSDIVFSVALLLSVAGMMLLPFKAAGDLLYTKPKAVQIAGKFLIGLWNLILQLFVPYVLIKTGSYLAWVLAALMLVVPIPLARYCLKRNNGIALAILWFIYGAVMLALPWIVYRVSGQPAVFYDWTSLWALVPAVLAGVVGAIICCLWTGWYFAVCFAFNGHNNEVGGAARIENFKQFIRFRLTPNGLTGYVIAVDDVSPINTVDDKGRTRDGSDLQPRLIDVFHLRCK